MLQQRDERALGLRIALDVALGHARLVGPASSCTSWRLPPTCDTLRAARVMKVRRPECGEQPSILSEV